MVALVFFLPIAFIPGGIPDVFNAKALLATVLVAAAFVLFALEAWKRKELSLPTSNLFFALAALVVVYFLSALLATPAGLSLWGYNVEVGTFGSLLLGLAILVLSFAAFSTSLRALQGLMAFFASLALVALFVAVKILSGGSWLTLGNFSGVLANPIGNFADLGVAFGLLASLSILALGVLPMKRLFTLSLGAVFLVSTVFLLAAGFSQAFLLAFAASVFLIFYFAKVESNFYFQGKSEGKRGFFSKKTVLPLLLGIISLVFFVNPALPSGSSLSATVSGAFHADNTDIRPTLATTLGIAKSVLGNKTLLGSGPNTFDQDWLLYKPAELNRTPFWSLDFSTGFGFLPTQIATAGLLGALVWAAFLIFLAMLAMKAFNSVPESRASRFALVSVLLTTLFLWASFLLYNPSLTLFLLAFVFTGALLGLGHENRIVSAMNLDFKGVSYRGASAVGLLALACGAVAFGWLELKDVVGAYHFEQAMTLANTPNASVEAVSAKLDKALAFSPRDSYYSALAQLDFTKAQVAANSATGTPEANQAAFQDSLGKSISAARSAITANPSNYKNWVMLGNVYSSLVPAPLKIQGAYESAQFSYSEALKRDPVDPQLPLLLAQLEVNKGDLDAARSYISNTLNLKGDDTDAYVLLARIEVAAKNLPGAIASAEEVSKLNPDNADVYFELGVLKYSANDFSGALESLNKAIELSTNYANARFYRALTLERLSRTEEARAELQSLLATNPENADVIKAALGDLAKAPAKKK